MPDLRLVAEDGTGSKGAAFAVVEEGTDVATEEEEVEADLGECKGGLRSVDLSVHGHEIHG